MQRKLVVSYRCSGTLHRYNRIFSNLIRTSFCRFLKRKRKVISLF